MLPGSAAEGLNGVAPQTENSIGGGGVECARCQQRRAATNSRHRMLPGAGHAQEGGCLPAPVSERGSYNAAKVWCTSAL